MSKYGAGNPHFAKRLILRGLKVLALFIVLNVSISILVPNVPVRTVFFKHFSLANLTAIFITGNVTVDGMGKTASFMILVAIGYLLVTTAILLMWCRVCSYTIHVVCCILLVGIFVLDRQGAQSANLQLVTIGLLGVLAGYIPSSKIAMLKSHPYRLSLAYCGYIGSITLLGVPFVLRVIGVCLTLALIYTAGARGNGPISRHIQVLGKYSLLGYISQIAILQVLHRSISHFNPGVWALPVSLFAGFALVMIGVEAVDRARPRSTILDRYYKAIFA